MILATKAPVKSVWGFFWTMAHRPLHGVHHINQQGSHNISSAIERSKSAVVGQLEPIMKSSFCLTLLSCWTDIMFSVMLSPTGCSVPWFGCTVVLQT